MLTSLFNIQILIPVMKRIKANVVYHWDHPNHKFFRGDKVKVNYVGDGESNVLKGRVGQVGEVLARSATKSGVARDGTSRQWTRYYVLFPDGEVSGFYSEYLSRVLRQSISF